MAELIIEGGDVKEAMDEMAMEIDDALGDI